LTQPLDLSGEKLLVDERPPFARVEYDVTSPERSERRPLIQEKARIALRLIEAVDETLTMLFGRKTAPKVYDYLENRFGLRKGDVPDRPEVLSNGLRDLFGSTTTLIELDILKRFSRKLNVEFESKERIDFKEYVIEMLDSSTLKMNI